MHFRGLDLNLLVVLDALLIEKNITRAGQRIYLSQSATSGALARLREFFGDPLLILSGQKMTLTPLAESLGEPVRQVLREAEAIISANSGFQPETSNRTFRLNMSDYSATVIMTEALDRIRKIAPGIHLEITSLQENVSQALESGDLDFLIIPPEFMSPLHPAEDLYEDNYVCIAWTGNTEVGDEISLDQYLHLGHVVARFGRNQQVSFDEMFIRRAGYERNVKIVLPAFSLLPNFVVGSNFIATVHQKLARYHQKYLPIKMFPVPVELPRYVAKIQWHRYHDHDPGVRWLHDLIQSVAERQAAPDSLSEVVKPSP